MSHTPRPWEAHGEVVQTTTRRLICTCTPSYGDGKANARLIAAAPELLEACKRARDRLIGEGLAADDEIWPILDDAIAKAEGQQ